MGINNSCVWIRNARISKDILAISIMNISTDFPSEIPILNPNISTQSPTDALRSMHRLDLTLERLFKLHPARNILLITSTFQSEVIRGDAMHRYEKLLRKLRTIGPEYLWVYERGHAGHVHFHLLLVVPFDVQENVDLERYSQISRAALAAKRKLVNRATKELWEKVDAWCVSFGIGRTEVAPLYSPPAAIQRYLLKSVKHNWTNRRVGGVGPEDLDKGTRWWSCSRGIKAVFGQFSMVYSPFREAVRNYAVLNGYSDLDELRNKEGRHWAYKVIRESSFSPSPLERRWGIFRLRIMWGGGATLGAPPAWI